MGKIKAAIVGAGIFGSFHARTFHEMPYVETVGICDLNKSRAEKLAVEYGIPNVYSDHREMLKKSGCDFISIVTPDHLHAEIAIDAANAKCDFLVEKPFATTVTPGSELSSMPELTSPVICLVCALAILTKKRPVNNSIM